MDAEKTSYWIKTENFSVNKSDELGKGAFGIVYSGRQNLTHRKVAVKEVKIKDDKTGSCAARELKTLHGLKEHENIVAFLDFFFSHNSLWMVMEYCDMGNLAEYYQKYQPIHISTNVSFMRQVASAITHLHALSKPIVHRDIKPANILVKYCGDKPVVKVTDFGVSKMATNDLSVAKLHLTSTSVGAALYLAPEQYGDDGYTYKVDIFSTGLVFLGMLSYKDNDQLAPILGKGSKIPVGIALITTPNKKIVPEETDHDDRATKSLKKLIAQMITADPDKRQEMAQVVQKLTEIFEPLRSQLPPPPPRPKLSEEEEKQNEEKKDDQESEKQHKEKEEEKEESEDEDTDDEESSEESDLLYLLIRQAAVQCAEERLKQEKQAKAAREELMKGLQLPLVHLLMRLQTDDVQDEEKGQAMRQLQLKTGDRVRIDDCAGDVNKAEILQQAYGGWVSRMEKCLGKSGEVQGRVLNAVKVKFDNGESWSFNPALVKKLDEQGHSPRETDTKDYSTTLESKFQRFDIVSITEDKERAKLLQLGHGGWNDKMVLSLGLKGIVSRVDKDGDVYAECINGDKWYFNPALLTKVLPTGNEELEPGDCVLVEHDIEKLKAIHKDQGGIPREIVSVVGNAVVVKKLLSDSRVVVEGGDDGYVIIDRKALKLFAKADEVMSAVLRKKLLS